MSQPPALGSSRSLDLDLHRRRSRARRVASHWRLLLLLAFVGGAVVLAAIATNTFGAGDRFDRLTARVERLIAGPVPTRSTRPTVVITEPPPATATPRPTNRPSSPPVASPTAAATPEPAPTPLPRVAVDFDLLDDPNTVFNHQIDKKWCAVAGTQMVLRMHGKGDGSDEFQREIASRIREWESYDDSRDGNWGPAAIALALEAYGVPGYEVRAYESRAAALRDSARQLTTTGAPVVLLTWRGAHTWVMTGYRADADPLAFADANVSGAYILDPWYPWNSSIWGQSDPPGNFEDLDELARNYPFWERPEGQYPDRDGKWIAVVPTLPVAP